MIIDSIESIERFLPHTQGRLKTALEFLSKLDLTNLQPGDVAIDGKQIYGKVSDYSTKEKSFKKSETHVKYIDIQCTLKGSEKVYTHEYHPDIKIVEDLRDKSDAIFYEVDDTDVHILNPGRFAVYFPWELHRPGCNTTDSSEVVRKLVIKVLV